MKQKWSSPSLSFHPVDLSGIGDVNQFSDAELKIELEKRGYRFQKKYQASKDFIHKKIADSDVLISIGSNIADFNGYIELNSSALLLWKKLQEPCELSTLEKALEEEYNISHDTAVEDVLEYMKFLLENNLVKVQ